MRGASLFRTNALGRAWKTHRAVSTQFFITLCTETGRGNTSTMLPKSPEPSAALKGLIGLVIIIFIFYRIGKHSTGSSTSTSSTPEYVTIPSSESVESSTPAYTTTAANLEACYQENEIHSDELFKGKLIKVTGRVESISKDFMNEPYILLSTGQYFQWIRCSLKDASQGSSLRKGQKVAVTGTCSGMVMQSVIMDHCTIE